MSHTSRSPFPVPIPDMDSAPFWEGCRQGELLLQRCSSCAAYRYPPRPICPDCHTVGGIWAKSSGRGKIYSWVIAYHPPRPEFADYVPYTIVLVDLEEGVRMVSMLVDTPSEAVVEGLPVEVTFERLTEQITLPRFRLTAAT